jgi:pimeloyl-ACP methyl ester carboxylesterase
MTSNNIIFDALSLKTKKLRRTSNIMLYFPGSFRDGESLESLDRFIETSGGKIFTRSWIPTNPGSTALVLLHDSLGCIETWRDFPARLAAELSLQVVAYDRLGFGKSDARTVLPSLQFIHEEAEIYLPEIAAQLGLSQLVVFGHSVGGGMALESAALHQNILAVITESAQAYVEDRTRAGIEAAKKDFQNPEKMERLKKYHGEKAEWVLHAWTDIWLSAEFANWSLEKVLPQIQCPVLILHGEKDEFGSVQFPNMIENLVSGFSKKIILSDCGHIPHKEQPELVIAELKEFLRKI